MGQMAFTIEDLQVGDRAGIAQAAETLVLAFAEHWPDAWPDIADGLEEVRDVLADDHICRVARATDGRVLGWIGGIPEYEGNVWELHPLAVHPDFQGRGVGAALVRDFEDQVRQRGGLTIMLGTDDVNNMTTLAGVDLYPNVLANAANVRNLKRHPYSFYEKLGFVIVGVLPDANGWGKPDIFMAKRLQP